MTDIINLYGTLILTVLGFVVPVLTLLISLFPEGRKALSLKYESERKQSEQNIENETKKLKDSEGQTEKNYSSLENTLKTLKKQLQEAELKLQYLKLTPFLLRTSLPFIFTLVAIFISLADISFNLIILALSFSFLGLIYGLRNLYTSISVLFEVAEIVHHKKNANEEKIIELLSTLVEKSGDNLFLKVGEVGVYFDKTILKEGSTFNYSENTKHSIDISINNTAIKMAKNVEIGFIFPKDVVIEKTSNLKLYSSEDSQIVRFNEDQIQARENKLQGKLNITFLNSGKLNIKAFIKGENVKYFPFNFELVIVK